MSRATFYLFVYGWITLAILLFPVLLKIPAPYGRHARTGWGPMIRGYLGWLVMEFPALAVFMFFFLAGPRRQNFLTWFFFSLWIIHYANRSLVYPFRIRHSTRRMPVSVLFMAFFFNCVNGFINGHYLGTFASGYPLGWLMDVRFICGVIFFLGGMGINLYSDHILIGLKRSQQGEYTIPQSGMFKYVSCPNFLGEIIEWAGYALMTWSVPALSFLVWTAVNLFPRAWNHHRWYRDRFKDYPLRRKALIPFLF